MDINIQVTWYHWVIFNGLILCLISADLWNSYRRPHQIKMKEAIWMSIGWISLALLFNLWIYFEFGKEPALAFLTGYLLEESLSVDNLFVFLVIFSHFKVPDHSKHTVLFYGILGAIVMRASLILGGIALIKLFAWLFYVFGIFLIYTGIKLAFKKEENTVRLEESILYKYLSSFIPMTSEYHGSAFVVKKDNQWIGTPLLVVIILLEFTDLIFALDSVPAILGITTNSFIVYTSNIFAILGLRSLFFVLERQMNRFYLLHYALAGILVFIGSKMLLANVIHIPITLTLSIIALFLLLAFVGSIVFPQKEGGSSNK